MIKNEIKLPKDFNKVVDLINKIDRLKNLYDGYNNIFRDLESENGLWKYKYFRGKELTIEEIKEDFAECFNDLIIDYVNEESKESSGE